MGYFTLHRIRCKLMTRHSFIHGRIRTYLTYMAAYAAFSELIHDFHHVLAHLTPEILESSMHFLFGHLTTKHAVGMIALSHLSEHYREKLEKEENPYEFGEHIRRDAFRVLKTQDADPEWRKYLGAIYRPWGHLMMIQETKSTRTDRLE